MLRRALSLAFGLWLVTAVAAYGQDWGQIANISATMGVNNGRICTGEASRGDIGCATYAPYVSSSTGRVGIGTTDPSSALHIAGAGHVRIYDVGALDVYRPLDTNNSIFNVFSNAGGTPWASIVRVSADGRMAINSREVSVTVPISTTLQVNGSLRLGYEAISPTLNVCDAHRRGAIKYESNDFYVCRNGSSWETLAAAAGGASGDRITSGTLAVTANSSTSIISLSTVSTTWGYLGSNASYLPNLTAAQVSATLISTSMVQVISQTTTIACSAGNAGSLRYNSANTALELCTGTTWQVMGVGIPAGTISAFASTTCPTGWSEYTAARGRFLRGIDNGAGNDPSGTRAPGTTQADALQNITGRFAGRSLNGSTLYSVTYSPGGAFFADTDASDANPVDISAAAATAGKYVGFDASRIARTTSETRPKNVAVTFCQFNGTSNGWNNPLSGGSTTPGGATGQIQYNTSGSFDASPNFTWTNADNLLTATNISVTALTVNGVAITGASSESDRIVSGTTNVLTQNGGSITITTNGSQRLVIGDNGMIGIGTSTPGVPFDVAGIGRFYGYRTALYNTLPASVAYTGPGSTTGMYFPGVNQVGLASNGTSALLISPSSVAGMGNTIGINGITNPSYTVDVSGSVRATRFIGDGSLLTNLPGGSSDRITSGTTQVIANNNTSVSIVTNGVERMVIGADGNIGVGQQPTATFPFSLTTTASGPLAFYRVSGTSLVSGGFYGYASDFTTPYLQSTFMLYTGAATNNMQLSSQGGIRFTTGGFTYTNNVMPTYERMRITSTGLVGIGIATPTTALEVSGTVSATYFVGDGSLLTNLPGGGGAGTFASLTDVSYVSATRSIFGPGSLTGAAGGATDATAFGHNALAGASNSGAQNTAIGTNALYSNTSGYNNVAVGYGTLSSGTTARQNVAIGWQAMASATTARLNVAVGLSALTNTLTGSNNTAVGVSTLGQNTTGAGNTAVGHSSISTNQTGIYNTAVGNGSLGLVNGSYNTAVGINAGYGFAGPTFTGNSLFGSSSGYGLSTGSSNTLIGTNAGYAVSSGSSNTLVGFNAGAGITTGSNNLVLGAQTTPYSNTGDNQLNIANAIWGNIGSGMANANRIGINVTSPTTSLEVSGTVSATRFIGDGSLLTNLPGGGGGATTFASLTDVSATAGSYNVFGPGSKTGANSGVQYSTAYGIGSLANASNSGNFNAAFGANALNSNTNGNNNSAFGTQSLNANTTGTDNTAIGIGSMRYSSTGTYNTAVGSGAGTGSLGNSTYNYNSLFGADAGRNLTTGSNNTLLGFSAGYGITTGSNNLILGTNTITLSNTGSNQLNIANAIWGNIGSGTSHMNLVGINATSPTAALEVSGTVSATILQLSNSPGNPCNAAAYGTIKVVNGRPHVCRQ